jgi:hypothetical protein
LGRAEPSGASEHGIPYSERKLALAGGERFRDEERVAERLPVEVLCVDTVRLRQHSDRSRRERLDPETADGLVRRHLAEDDPERVRAVELVVAVRGDDESGHGVHATGEEAQDVERGLVRSVHVFDHEDRELARRQHTQERRANVVWPGAAVDKLLELTAGDLGDIEERSERAGGEQRIAGTPKNARRAAAVVAEAA